jgi:hypothetical protein
MSKNAPLIAMETPSQYREFAQTCDRLAGLVESEAHRALLIEMTEEWTKLAREAENRKSQSLQPSESGISPSS